jgi:hypothetical protein
VTAYPLLDALRDRRSRRFARGMTLPGGALAYQSASLPQPLTEDEESLLAFAACGITGLATADMCYTPEGGGGILAGFAGRTVASGDALQTVSLIYTNDKGAWFLRRPADFAPKDLSELIGLAQGGQIQELHRRSAVRLSDRRVSPPKEPLFNINANRWSVYAPGTTWFLPVNDLTSMYINGLLEIFNEHTGAFALDERAGFQPAGLRKFGRSRGGHLEDDPVRGRVVTVKHIETLVTEFVTIEQGMMLQNLGLMAQALGLGGFPSFANHEWAWFEALGFRMGRMPASRYLGAGPLVTLGLKLLGKDVDVPYPLGLEVNGRAILKPYCPPYYSSMRQAVEAFVAFKFGQCGIYRSSETTTGWLESQAVRNAVPGPSEPAIEATIAYCEYLWNRYGRFPVHLAPFRTVLGFQACHLDPDFYAKFYRPEAISATQREDFRRSPR